jgi:hypothetical protein
MENRKVKTIRRKLFSTYTIFLISHNNNKQVQKDFNFKLKLLFNSHKLNAWTCNLEEDTILDPKNS